MSSIFCLLYHRVNGNGNDIYNMTVTPENFEQHMKYLKSRYPIVKFDDDWSAITEDSVVVTFDDGYMDNYTYAFPILKKYQIPATFFITTGNIDTYNEFWWDELERLLLQGSNYPNRFELQDEIYHYIWRTDSRERRKDLITILRCLLRCDPYIKRRNLWIEQLRIWSGMEVRGRDINMSMGIRQIKELATFELITIGGHTVNHQSLGSLPYDRQEREIENSIRELERIVEKKIDTYSYPFGKEYDYSEETFDLLRKYGVRKAATTSQRACGNEESQFAIPRISVGDLEIEEFKKLLSVYDKTV